MSGRRRRSESSWDRKESQNDAKEFNSNSDSPKRSISEINDVLMSDDFNMHGNENILMDNDDISDRHRMKTDPAFDEWENQYGQPYRGSSRVVASKDRARSRSPHRTRVQDQDRDRDRAQDRDRDRAQDRDRDRAQDRDRDRAQDRDRDRDQDRDRGRARSPSRGGSKRLDNDSTERWNNNRPEYSGGSRYNRTLKSGYDDKDHSRQSNQSIKQPCRFFIMGRCNRNNCRFSHDFPKSENYEERSHDHNDFPNPNPNFDEKNRSWNDPSWNNLESQLILDNSDSHNINLNGNEPNLQLNGGSVEESGKLLETSTNDTVNAFGFPNSASFGGPVDSMVVNDPVKVNEPMEGQKSTEPVGNEEVNETKIGENSNMNIGKNEAEGNVEEGNLGNDEKAMRAFKNALVEFVKEILKPTWKEGKMSREVYKTIVKKVVEKVTSTIQGIQIPRTQEKIDQYLVFSKSKITKLVEAYVGRLVKA